MLNLNKFWRKVHVRARPASRKGVTLTPCPLTQQRNLSGVCMSRKYYVYIHRRQSDGRIFYVGKGCDRRAYSTYKRGKWWEKVSSKHGRIVEIVRHFQSEHSALDFEITLIAFFRMSQPLVNITDGGDGVSGLRHSEESKAKMSGPRPNAKQWLKGCNAPDYLKEKWRKAKLGKKQSPEHAEKSRTNKTGCKISDTSKFNLDKRKPVKNCQGEVFKSAAEAARVLSQRIGVNASQGNITMCIHGTRKSAYGMKWSFA